MKVRVIPLTTYYFYYTWKWKTKCGNKKKKKKKGREGFTFGLSVSRWRLCKLWELSATEDGFCSSDLGLNPSCLPSPPNSQRHIFIKWLKAISLEQEPSDPTQLHPLNVQDSVLAEPAVPMVQKPVSRRHLFH